MYTGEVNLTKQSGANILGLLIATDESICADSQPFITSKEFPSLDKDILYGLLKRDDLQIEEIVAWDNLIKWGIKQTPGLDNNSAKWNNSNYEALKKSLSKFVPLIRFSEIS